MSVPATSASRVWGGFACALVIGFLVIALPTPAGLSRPAQMVLGVTALTVTLWMLRTLSNGIVSILMMGLMVLVGVKAPVALSGFASPSFWMLLAVLFYGFAMQSTGLAQRVAFHILSLLPCSYRGILMAFLAIGTALALGIPSSTVRAAIMVPIAWALVKSLNLADHSRGSALIMLTTIEMAVVPGSALRYGSLFGPVVDSVFQVKHLPLTWMGYAEAIFLPVMLLSVLIPFGNQLALSPEPLDIRNSDFAKERLAALGPLKRDELITALLVIGSFVYWSTDRYHHLPGFLIGMLVVPVFTLFGILREENISTAVSWNLLLFLGGAFSLANIIQEFRITDWLAGYFIPVANSLAFSPLLMLMAAAIAMFATRFLDPSGFIAIPVLFLPIVDVASTAGVPPLALTAALLMACAPLWLSYQNVWIAMGEGITKGLAFTNGQRIRVANVYAALVLLSLAVATGYWKLIGIF